MTTIHSGGQPVSYTQLPGTPLVRLTAFQCRKCLPSPAPFSRMQIRCFHLISPDQPRAVSCVPLSDPGSMGPMLNAAIKVWLQSSTLLPLVCQATQHMCSSSTRQILTKLCQDDSVSQWCFLSSDSLAAHRPCHTSHFHMPILSNSQISTSYASVRAHTHTSIYLYILSVSSEPSWDYPILFLFPTGPAKMICMTGIQKTHDSSYYLVQTKVKNDVS